MNSLIYSNFYTWLTVDSKNLLCMLRLSHMRSWWFNMLDYRSRKYVLNINFERLIYKKKLHTKIINFLCYLINYIYIYIYIYICVCVCILYILYICTGCFYVPFRFCFWILCIWNIFLLIFLMDCLFLILFISYEIWYRPNDRLWLWCKCSFAVTFFITFWHISWIIWSTSSRMLCFSCWIVVNLFRLFLLSS